MEPGSPSIPSLLALLLCEYVIVEARTEKKTIVGVFDDIWSPTEPVIQRVAFFARLTDLQGLYRFNIKVVRITKDGEELVAAGEVATPESFEDPLKKLDIALNLPPTTFPGFGMYEFQLFANDIYLGRAVLNCRREVPTQ